MAGHEFSRAELEALRVSDLREILRAMDLPVAGLKLQLIERIIEAQYNSKTKAVVLELQLSHLENASKELELSRFLRNMVNLDSTRVNVPTQQNAASNLPRQHNVPSFQRIDLPNRQGGGNQPQIQVNANLSRHHLQDMDLTLAGSGANNSIQCGEVKANHHSIVKSVATSDSSDWLIKRSKPDEAITSLQPIKSRAESDHNYPATAQKPARYNTWLSKPKLTVEDRSNNAMCSDWLIPSQQPVSCKLDLGVAHHQSIPNQTDMTLCASNHCAPHVSHSCSHSESADNSKADSLFRAQEHRELVEAIRAPSINPPVFSGDLIDYPRWRKAFNVFINQRVNPSSSDKLYYLDKYTAGPVSEVIQSYIYLDSESAYQDALKDIENLYGNNFLVAEAFKKKLLSWPKIQINDSRGIFSLTNFLKQCRTAMNDISDLKCLDLPEKNQQIVRLLPDYISRQWNSKSTDYQIKHGNAFPPFSYFVEFLMFESAKANNPITSVNALRQTQVSDKSGHSQSKPKTNRDSSNVNKYAVTHHTTTTNQTKPKENRKCCLCNAADHFYVSKCQTFKDHNVDDRWKVVQTHKLCHRCLGPNHPQSKCNKDWKCSKCSKQNHHTLLHRESMAPARSPTSTNTVCNATQEQVSTDSGCIFSPIIPVWVSSLSDPNNEILTYAMIDSQSNRTFITEDLASLVNSKSSPANLEISTMTSVRKPVACHVFSELRVRGFYSSVFYDLPMTFTRQQIPCCVSDIPSTENIHNISHLENIRDYIAPKLNCSPGLLLGRDCHKAVIIQKVMEPPDDCAAQAIKYALGWTIVGPSQPNSNTLFTDQVGVSHYTYSVPKLSDGNPKTSICFKTQINDVTPRELMKQIDGLEFQESNITGPTSQDDLKFMNILDQSTCQDDRGFYVMPLPFKQSGKLLESTNYEPVLKRFHGLLAQFKRRDDEFKRKYSEFMNGFIARGEAEIVPQSDLERGEGCWYLPHHGVLHKKTKKLRCVFDCSSEYMGQSLNDKLLPGPDLNNSLLGVLMRFRQKPIALCCDIEKMFHRFYVTPEHRDYMRFFWLDDENSIKTYRMCVHIFGARSSPSCAKYGLNRLAQEHGNSFPLAQQFIQRSFYVDDGLYSVDTTRQAIDLLQETKEICSKGNLRVHKLLSNSVEVLESFPPEDVILDCTKDITLVDTERALGMLWSISSDSFKYSYKPIDKIYTRRTLLTNVASVYDPLGLLSPLLLSGRNLIQQTCKTGLSWDDPIDDDTAKKCKLWDIAMSKLSQVSIPRCIHPIDFVPVRNEIHTFADASLNGYGACTYVRSFNAENRVHCSLLLGKSRVAPLKPTTVPRLELQAGLLAARQSKSVLCEMGWECEAFLWSDSQIVLGYIHNDAKRFQTFVANRLSQIHDISKVSQWQYVRTDKNPADIASRGVISTSELCDSMWFSGPSFLWNNDVDVMHEAADKFVVNPSDPELRKTAVTLKTESKQSLSGLEQSIIEISNRSSSWTKTKFNVAAMLNILSTSSFKSAGRVTSDQYQTATTQIIKAIQKSYFSEELCSLSSGQSVDKSSSLQKLDCYVDQEGIIRVGGRMKHSISLSECEKHPVVLPKHGNLSSQVIRYYHEQAAHQGRTTTMSAVRSAGYWIVGLNSVVSSIIYKCVLCRKLRRPVEVQKMADLPPDRVEVTPPFTNVGCDVFGPFPVKDGRKCMKRYGLIFTCLVSRAVHIEVLDDLSTDSFLQSWRCFISLRGNVKLLRCDNGTNFVGAHNEISKLLLEMSDSPEVIKLFREANCKFMFNPPLASHMGGAWERLIRSIRAVFSGLTAQMHNLSSTNLRTLMYECMNIINSRPLSSITDECKPLTPNDLLHMKSDVILPMPGKFSENDLYSRKRWRMIQLLVNNFWDRWKKEYLHQLQGRNRWLGVKRNLCVNDVVILYDECNRLGWKLGRVIEVVPSSDDLVRSVKVMTADVDGSKKEYSRPVAKLVCILESHENV